MSVFDVTVWTALHWGSVSFEVLGLTCASCVSTLDRALRAVEWPSVKDVRVKWLANQAFGKCRWVKHVFKFGLTARSPVSGVCCTTGV